MKAGGFNVQWTDVAAPDSGYEMGIVGTTGRFPMVFCWGRLDKGEGRVLKNPKWLSRVF